MEAKGIFKNRIIFHVKMFFLFKAKIDWRDMIHTNRSLNILIRPPCPFSLCIEIPIVPFQKVGELLFILSWGKFCWGINKSVLLNNYFKITFNKKYLRKDNTTLIRVFYLKNTIISHKTQNMKPYLHIYESGAWTYMQSYDWSMKIALIILIFDKEWIKRFFSPTKMKILVYHIKMIWEDKNIS